jgi:uncharacterized protein with PIN domain
VGVPCSKCGREYDVTLFEFGRTIHCTCGARVGLEPRVRELGDEGRQRFIADAMLGRLAHWLRLLGVDCAHDPEIDDERLVRRALEERRVILTRDASLPEEWHILGIHLVAAKTPIAQLREVAGEFKLAGTARPFSRCSRCNAVLVSTTAEELRERERAEIPGQAPARESERSERQVPQRVLQTKRQVPQRVLRTRDELWRCPECGRVYWEGSHTAQMREVIDQVLEEQP